MFPSSFFYRCWCCWDVWCWCCWCWCSSIDYFEWFRHSMYVGSCLDCSGGSRTDFGGRSWWDLWFMSGFGTVSTFFTAISFWWWILIALWHSVTKRGSTYEFFHLYLFFFSGGEFIFVGWSLWSCLDWDIHVRGSVFFIYGSIFILYASCFKLLIDLCLWVIHWYMSLLCVVFEIKILFYLLVLFPHMWLCILFKVFQKIYKLIQLSCCLLLQLMDGS